MLQLSDAATIYARIPWRAKTIVDFALVHVKLIEDATMDRAFFLVETNIVSTQIFAAEVRVVAIRLSMLDVVVISVCRDLHAALMVGLCLVDTACYSEAKC